MSPGGKVFAFTLPVTVHLRDLDALGHVNNAVYLTYLETTRNRWVFDLTGKKTVHDFDFILARTHIQFRSAASLHESLNVALRPVRLGTSSWDLEYEVREARSGRLVVEADSTQVMYNYQALRSMPIPQGFRRTLEEAMKRCGVGL